ncbi:phage tail protein [Parasphingorhabdus sp. JC815]|uniref:phage tail protein n=1 Tax=Parasphingorhabdus sp. JC815 TaxID=3232140 RepID=UPI003459FB54
MTRELLSLGMFVFGMDSLAYSEMERRIDWRHALSERFGARPASQFVGPGADTITLSGMLVPEIAGSYGAIDRLIEMAGTGDHWPLVDGSGKVLGEFRIIAVDQRQKAIMAGGFARATDFAVDLERAD